MIDNTQMNIDTNTDSIPSILSEKERLKQEIESHQIQTLEKTKRLEKLDLDEWEPTLTKLLEVIKSSPRFPVVSDERDKLSRYRKVSEELMEVFGYPVYSEQTGNKTGKVTGEDKYIIQKLHKEGKSKWDISREVKRTVETVEKIIKEGVN
jgi:hypothetical protein